MDDREAFPTEPANLAMVDRLRRGIYQAHAVLQADHQEPPGGVPVCRANPGGSQGLDLNAQQPDQIGFELFGGLTIRRSRVAAIECPERLGCLCLLLSPARARGIAQAQQPPAHEGVDRVAAGLVVIMREIEDRGLEPVGRADQRVNAANHGKGTGHGLGRPVATGADEDHRTGRAEGRDLDVVRAEAQARGVFAHAAALEGVGDHDDRRGGRDPQVEGREQERLGPTA